MLRAGGSIIYPAATALESGSTPAQALETLQAVLTQPLPGQHSSTPQARGTPGRTPGKRRGAGQGVGMLVVICDELDQLMSTAQDVLYDLFFLPQVSLGPAPVATLLRLRLECSPQGAPRIWTEKYRNRKEGCRSCMHPSVWIHRTRKEGFWHHV